ANSLHAVRNSPMRVQVPAGQAEPKAQAHTGCLSRLFHRIEPAWKQLPVRLPYSLPVLPVPKIAVRIDLEPVSIDERFLERGNALYRQRLAARVPAIPRLAKAYKRR